jgi:uncharacterized protein YhbP (UPF0306 family)
VDEARRLLEEARVMTLAVTDEGGPWAADVYFVLDRGALCFFSSPESRHAKALAANPAAAATIHTDAEDWRDIRGIQLKGEVSEPGAAEAARAAARYVVKFPFAAGLLDAAGGSLRRKVRLYCLTPTEVYWVDNGRGLGKREMVDPW